MPATLSADDFYGTPAPQPMATANDAAPAPPDLTGKTVTYDLGDGKGPQTSTVNFANSGIVATDDGRVFHPDQVKSIDGVTPSPNSAASRPVPSISAQPAAANSATPSAASAVPTTISVDDFYNAKPANAPTSPQMTGAWREPALAASSAAKGAVNSIPGTIDYVFGPRAYSPVDPDALKDAKQNNLVNVARGLEDPKTDAQLQGDIQNSGASAMPLTRAVDAPMTAAGIINRPDLQPQGFGEQYLAAGAESAGGMIPFVAGGGIPSVARGVLQGFTGGVGSKFASDAFPGSQVAPVLGSLSGFSVPSVAEMVARSTIAPIVRPLTGIGRDAAAVNQVRSAATDPASLAKLDAAPSDLELVPGSQPTTFQVTGDPGLGNLERKSALTYPDKFLPVAADQNAARVGAISALAPETATPQAVADAVREHLANLDAATDQAVASTKTTRDAAVQNLGGVMTPEQVGGIVRGETAANYAPKIARADSGVTTARAILDKATGDIGGNMNDGQNGAIIRGNPGNGEEPASGLAGALAQTKAATGALWKAIDPDGTLALDVSQTKQGIRRIAGDVPLSAAPISPAERGIYDTVSNWPATQSFTEFQAMRQRIGDLLRSERAQPGADTQMIARLTQARQQMDDALSATVEKKVASDQDAVAAGTMDPQDTLAARYAQKAQDWYNSRDAAVPTQIAQEAGRVSSVGGGQDATSGSGGFPSASRGGSQAGRQSGGFTGDQSLQGNEPLTPTWDDEASTRYRAARGATADQKQTFSAGPVGQALRAGPQGQQFALADEQVPGRFFNAGARSKSDIAAFLKASGSRPEAVSALKDYAASSLRDAAIRDDGTLDTRAYARWMKAHDDALSAFPELRSKFGTVAKAQGELDQAIATRKGLEKAYPIKPGMTDSEVAANFFRAGQGGAEDIARFKDATGGSPEAYRALQDYAAGSLSRSAVGKDGTLDLKAYDRWMASHEPALKAFPDLIGKFKTAEAAQRAVDEAAYSKQQTIAAFQKSAAGSLLGKDPVKAIGDVFGSGNPAINMRDIVQLVKADPAAINGLKRAVVDYMIGDRNGRFLTNKAAGETGTNFLKSDQIQTFIRQQKPALGWVFGKAGTDTLERVAADLQRSERSVSGTKLPGGSNSPQDLAAAHRYGKEQSFMGELANGMGHGLGLFALVEHAGWPVAIGAAVLRSLRRMGIESTQEVTARMMRDPVFANAMLQKYPAKTGGNDLAKRLAGIAAVQSSQQNHRGENGR